MSYGSSVCVNSFFFWNVLLCMRPINLNLVMSQSEYGSQNCAVISFSPAILPSWSSSFPIRVTMQYSFLYIHINYTNNHIMQRMWVGEEQPFRHSAIQTYASSCSTLWSCSTLFCHLCSPLLSRSGHFQLAPLHSCSVNMLWCEASQPHLVVWLSASVQTNQVKVDRSDPVLISLCSSMVQNRSSTEL